MQCCSLWFLEHVKLSPSSILSGLSGIKTEEKLTAVIYFFSFSFSLRRAYKEQYYDLMHITLSFQVKKKNPSLCRGYYMYYCSNKRKLSQFMNLLNQASLSVTSVLRPTLLFIVHSAVLKGHSLKHTTITENGLSDGKIIKYPSFLSAEYICPKKPT